ncbi:MAG: hypothetical protein ACRDK1_09960 [Solirubrobacterales bacterium]
MGKRLIVSALCTTLIALGCAAPAAIAGHPVTKPVGWGPLTSEQAANRVQPSSWEPRPDNRTANGTVPGTAQLRDWRKQSDMPYARFVDGGFRGTTDEIIQWAAYKWGFRPGVLRAVATVESWWHQSAVGDNGDSFGLFQVRRPYHCRGECRIARDSTAFNADYYGGILRAYYDGKMTWLNTVERGRDYRAGDLWGSVGAWYAGRWWTDPAKQYIRTVCARLAERTWRTPGF